MCFRIQISVQPLSFSITKLKKKKKKLFLLTIINNKSKPRAKSEIYKSETNVDHVTGTEKLFSSYLQISVTFTFWFSMSISGQNELKIICVKLMRKI